ncbi:hypothetical protein DL96DRAFT_1100006 [Flagelloscypha sp. PMI_526]|nr:hypothetical protein DL96DRAFT_1100006 [Flagelloscypha sp. PMI_526]
MGRKKISELQVAATLLPNATTEAIQNANLQIFQLPAEILAYIFLFYKHSTIEDEVDKTRWLTQFNFNHDAVPYIAPSHVCSYWRRVALNTPSFWSTLLLNHIGWGEELIRRSGRAPLDVYRNTRVEKGHSRTIFLRCLSQALQESHRIRSVDLTKAFLYGNSLWRSLPQYLNNVLEGIQISKLQYLTLSELPLNVSWFDSFSRVVLVQSWEYIRELDMPCSKSYLIPKLRSNSLVNLRLRGIPHHDLDTFLQSLESFPRLESLALLSLWSDHSQRSRLRPRIHLPHLSELELSFDSATCDYILSILSDQPLRILRISAEEDSPIPPDSECPLKLCKRVADQLKLSEDRVYPCIDLGVGGLTSICSFIPEETVRWSNLQSGKCSVPYYMLVGWDNHASNLEATLASAQSSRMPRNASVVLSLPTSDPLSDTFHESLKILSPAFRHTKTIVFRASRRIIPDVFQHRMETLFKLLSQLPCLEVLHIVGHLMGQNAIAKGFEIFSNPDDVDPAAPIFPRLQSICLQGLLFGNPPHNPSTIHSLGFLTQSTPLSYPPPFDGIPYKDFVSSIRAIKAVGAPTLQFISFKSCYQVGDDFVADLEKAGVTVERDELSMRQFRANTALFAGLFL